MTIAYPFELLRVMFELYVTLKVMFTKLYKDLAIMITDVFYLGTK
jgi:hypothetical protein